MINLLYVTGYLFHKKKTADPALSNNATTQKITPCITVQKGSTEKQVEIQHCALFITIDKVVWLYTYSHEQYRLSGTLQHWENKLSKMGFHRLNRQCLATYKVIQSVEQTDTRRLKIKFVLPIDEVYVSKSNVTSFRKWWKNNSPV